jgi:FkbM family methyltransferase
VKKIIEKISWVPYNIIYNRESKKQNPIKLNLEHVGVKKDIIFHVIDNDEGLSKQLRLFGFREPLNWKEYYCFVDEEDVVLDVGANIGLFSILSKNAKKIICIEPIRECIPILEKNLDSNNLLDKSIIINMAVGKKGKLFLKKEDHINLSKIVNKKGRNVQEIKSEDLGYFTKKYKTNLVRIDVEGYEYEILKQGIPKRINKIAMEFHAGLLGNKKIKEILWLFHKEKFRIKYIIEDLPLRLYPFYKILKKTGLIKFFTYVKKDLNPLDCYHLITRGRSIKYLFLKR